METAFTRISIIDLYDRIVAGLGDEDDDIKALCNLMVTKLIFLDPDETSRRLGPMAEAFRKTLSKKLKDSAVKQEIEKRDESNKAALRVTLLLGEKLKATGTSGSIEGSGMWVAYWEWVNANFAPQLKTLREESKERGSE